MIVMKKKKHLVQNFSATKNKLSEKLLYNTICFQMFKKPVLRQKFCQIMQLIGNQTIVYNSGVSQSD